MTRIAIMGGAFDPFHFAHASMAIAVLREGLCDEVWLCPSPPRWDKSPVAPLERRVEWVRLASVTLKRLSYRVELCTQEIAFGAYRGSYFFLSYLKKSRPDCDFVLVLGTDSFNTIGSWRDPTTQEHNGTRLLKEFEIIVFERGQEPESRLIAAGKVHVLTAARAFSQVPQGFPPPRVLEALNSTALRGDLEVGKSPGTNWTFEEIARDIEGNNPYLGNAKT